MTHTIFTKRIAAGLVAATISTATLVTPAAAGGSISFNFAPRTADEANALRTGLAIYGLIKGAKNGGNISQNGTNNSAGLQQYGQGNFGVVHQDGRGHNGTVQQYGGYNSYGLFQFGKNTNGHVTQQGYRGTGATFQFGW